MIKLEQKTTLLVITENGVSESFLTNS